VKETRLLIRKRSPAEQAELLNSVDLSKLTTLEMATWHAEHADQSVALRLADAEWQRRGNKPLVVSAVAGALGGAFVSIAFQGVLAWLAK